MNSTSSTLRSAIIASLALLSTPAPALAAGPVHFGVKAGVAIANVDPTDVVPGVDLKTKTGPGGGAFGTWEVNQHLGIQGELLYVSKGFSWGKGETRDEQGNLSGTYEALQVVDYLEVPLLLRAAWATSGPVSPAVIVGAAVSFKVRERFKTTGAVEGSEKDDRFQSSDAGVVAGAELRLRAGPGWSLIEARYTLGLIDVVGQERKNRALTLMAGTAF